MVATAEKIIGNSQLLEAGYMPWLPQSLCLCWSVPSSPWMSLILLLLIIIILIFLSFLILSFFRSFFLSFFLMMMMMIMMMMMMIITDINSLGWQLRNNMKPVLVWVSTVLIPVFSWLEWKLVNHVKQSNFVLSLPRNGKWSPARHQHSAVWKCSRILEEQRS